MLHEKVFLVENSCCWNVHIQLFMNFPGKSFLIDVNCATTFVMDESDFYDKGKSVEKGRSQTRSFLSLIMNCENTVFCENSRKTQEKLWNEERNRRSNFQFHFHSQIALCCSAIICLCWRKGCEWSVYCPLFLLMLFWAVNWKQRFNWKALRVEWNLRL